SVFYLSKYSVTLNKFKMILQRKIKRDLVQKKISDKQYEESNELVELILKKFIKLNIINDKRNIKARIQSLVAKGNSFKKITLYLIKDQYEKDLIYSEIDNLKNNLDFEIQLIETYCKKKKLGIFDTSYDQNNSMVHNRTLNKLLRQGFNLDNCLNFLKK
ncbi:RecX family transcriptional regulator, partial [Rickettsiales bacterium]|nr:RecX family transcriptional regulator [Rickettsiales bacterium]